MKRMMKFAAATGVAGVLAMSLAVPSYAEHGRNAAAAIGFGAGALVGAAAADSVNSPYYAGGYGYRDYGYRGGYYRGGPYAYERGPYAAAPAYGTYGGGYDAYAYAPQTPMIGSSAPSCATDGTYGKRFDYVGCY